MHIVFRADASIAIGSGHVMRCLALADALRAKGALTAFICIDVPGEMSKLIRDKGHTVYLIPEVHSADHDALLTQEGIRICFNGTRTDCLIVDHYRLDACWESSMRDSARTIFVIDDLANRPHDSDMLLDQNLYPDMDARYARLLSSRCKLLLGPRYALLRPEFLHARSRLRERDGTIKKILIFFGATDPTRETGKVLSTIRRMGLTYVDLDVVAGMSNPEIKEIEKQCIVLGASFHCQVSTMAELMSNADLAIGAGGTATWERCCVGLPAIVISIAENQEAVARSLGDLGALRYLGTSSDVTEERLTNEIVALLHDPSTVRAMSAAGMQQVDGAGISHVVSCVEELILSTRVTLRRACIDDELYMHEWRNSPLIRASSFDEKVIPLEDHRRWFRDSLQNTERHILIAEAAGEPVGVLRYDAHDDYAEVSIYLQPGKAGQGLGTRVLQEGTDWVGRCLMKIHRIQARIRPENHGSRKAFAKAGYIECDGMYVKELASNDGRRSQP